MIGRNGHGGDKSNEPRRESDMQAAVTRELSTADTSAQNRSLFARFWEDVAPFNNFSPEAARALLARETATDERMLSGPLHDGFTSDPWAAVRAALKERAAGRIIAR